MTNNNNLFNISVVLEQYQFHPSEQFENIIENYEEDHKITFTDEEKKELKEHFFMNYDFCITCGYVYNKNELNTEYTCSDCEIED